MKALARYQVILLGEQMHIRCQQLAHGCCPNIAAAGVEPVTSRSRVRRPTTTLPSHLIIIVLHHACLPYCITTLRAPAYAPASPTHPLYRPTNSFASHRFCVAAPIVWNTLLSDICTSSSYDRLKMCYFITAFNNSQPTLRLLPRLRFNVFIIH